MWGQGEWREGGRDGIGRGECFVVEIVSITMSVSAEIYHYYRSYDST